MTCCRKSNVLSVTLFVAVIVFAISDASATDYYIDSVGGNDSAAGTATNTAWKSHTKAQSTSLAAGDVVHFKCGSAFSGPIEITESGTAANPIRLTSYGTGERPKFTNPSNSTTQMHGNCIRLGSSGGGGDYIIVETLHFHDTLGDPTTWAQYVMTTIGALRIRRGADHCIVRNNVFTKCLQGIMSAGEHTLITGNYMDCGLNAPSLWRSDSSSWGPMGMHINIGNHEISYNTIKNYGTSDSPWGSDGGAIEIDYGSYHKTNIFIHHNYSEGNAGFIESSWDYDWPQYSQEAKDWRVSFNVCYDGQSWLFMLAPCTGVYFDNNTVARYNGFGRAQDSGARMDVQGGSPVGVASGAHFRNNLFIYTSSPYTGNRSGGALKTANWYLSYNNFSTVYGGDGNQAGSGDPKLKNLNSGNYKLMPDSPLRGKGMNLSSLYSVDFNGQTLRTNGNWDVGAMQYIVDDDADGIADAWEFDHGLNINTNDAAGNNDGDAASNYAEYIADTNPTNPLSVFALGCLSERNMTIFWAGSTNRRYSLWYATNLVSASPWTPVSQMTNLPGTSGIMVYTNPVTDPQGFFRTSVFLAE
jgi:hypothetical protein